MVGDPVYRHGHGTGGEPLMLYARSIIRPLYPARPPFEVTAPVPLYMRAALRSLGCEG